MKSKDLTQNEKEFIKEREVGLNSLMEAIETAKAFKEGDYLIAYDYEYEYERYGQPTSSAKKIYIKNSYGALKKYKVVATDKHGIPYIKELNKHGAPIGMLLSTFELDTDYDGFEARIEMRFEIDPDYADAMIMDDTANYDPSIVHKLKADLRKEIINYNKENLITEHKDNKYVAIRWANSLKVGDVLWRSTRTSWTILDILSAASPKNFTFANHYDDFIKIKDSSGKEQTLSFMQLRSKVFYKNRPRSFNELKDLK